MRLRDDRSFDFGNWLTIDVAEQSPKGRPDAGDVRFALRLRFGNSRDQTFFARTHAWVGSDVLKAFVSQLEVLERNRQGIAEMTSMSPGELVLAIEVVDRAGHLVARGQLGRHVYGPRGDARWVSLPFEIRFDPTDLPSLVRYFRGMV